jgi:hypothetical protein
MNRGDEQVSVAGVALLKSVGRLRPASSCPRFRGDQRYRGVRRRRSSIIASNERIAVDWRRQRLAVAAVSPSESNVAKQGIFGLLSLDRDARRLRCGSCAVLTLCSRPMFCGIFPVRGPKSVPGASRCSSCHRRRGGDRGDGKLTELIGQIRGYGACDHAAAPGSRPWCCRAVRALPSCREARFLRAFRLAAEAGQEWAAPRALAGLAIQKWKERIGPDWLAERLRDPSEEVRLCVARELGTLDLTGCDALVSSMLRDPSYWVAKAALDCLCLTSGCNSKRMSSPTWSCGPIATKTWRSSR